MRCTVAGDCDCDCAVRGGPTRPLGSTNTGTLHRAQKQPLLLRAPTRRRASWSAHCAAHGSATQRSRTLGRTLCVLCGDGATRVTAV
jgi:hypothetical protein